MRGRFHDSSDGCHRRRAPGGDLRGQPEGGPLVRAVPADAVVVDGDKGRLGGGDVDQIDVLVTRRDVLELDAGRAAELAWRAGEVEVETAVRQ